ncbi:MAG: T9SS type A sorting domain-containing protein [Chitinophagaceae bacterium]
MRNIFTCRRVAVNGLKAIMLLLANCLLIYAKATTYTVTKTADDGSSGTLRWAITQANASAGADIIQFAIGTSGNLFESSGTDKWAVIEIGTSLPTITGALLIDGFTQTNTNTGAYAGKTVGVDNIVQPNINYPDVYIVPSSTFSFPSSSNTISGNGINVNSVDVTIRGIAISGFGNTNSVGGTASGHAEISFLRITSVRNTNFLLYNCFFSCDPRGVYPTIARRRSKGSSILVCGNNYTGVIRNNLVAYSGTYGIHFNGLTDNLGVGPSNTLLANNEWDVYENILIDITRNTGVTSAQSSDGITTSMGKRMTVSRNYIENVEQTGIDLGWNADSIYVENNTITGFVKTTGAAPQSGIRISLCTERDTLIKNKIFNNTGTEFLGGIWIDEYSLSQTGMVTKNNSNNFIYRNTIYGNSSSGITISTNGSGTAINNKISQNSIYNNIGLGIDLGYANTTGPTLVSVNDNGDGDSGPNNMQNFPIIDSAKLSSVSSYATIWGKAPAGSTIEFFIGDGGVNKHYTPSLKNLNYGEGKTYIGSGVEGSGSDGVSGTGSYAIDGNSAVSNVNMFRFSFFYGGTAASLALLTSTATVSNNTSEFGPVSIVEIVLGCTLLDISALHADGKTKLFWTAICDESFNNFIIERSTDGSNFTRIGQVNKIPGKNDETDFNYTDNFPPAGNSYYRLKMMNADGSFKYSKIMRVNVQSENKNSLKVSPNPFVSEVNLVFTAEKDENINVRITDNSGRVMMTQQIKGHRGANIFDIDDLGRLPKGAYIIEVFSDSQVMREKIIKN